MLVGFGHASITPRGGKVAIAGKLPPRLTDSVHDDIQAVAMIIGTGAERTIWVCCDMCHPTAVLTAEVVAELEKCIPDFHKDQLLLSATHSSACTRLVNDFLTISEIAFDEEMLPLDQARHQVRDGIIRAILGAQSKMVDCTMSFSKADIITGLCRRAVYSDGKAIMYGKTDRDDFIGMEYPDSGPTQVLYFHSVTDRTLVGIFAAVPCPAQADESSDYLTADYWYVVRQRVKAAFGNETVVLGVCASAGELATKRLFGICHRPVNGPERALELGNQIADSIIENVNRPLCSYSESEMFCKRISAQIDFPVRRGDARSIEEAQRYFATPENFKENGTPVKQVEYNKHKYTLRLHDSGKTTHTAQISALRIADVLLYTSPAELYSAYAKRINARFPDHPVIDVQLTNDNMGYLPTAEAIAHGGYSTYNFNTITGPEGGEVLVSAVKQLLRTLTLDGDSDL